MSDHQIELIFLLAFLLLFFLKKDCMSNSLPDRVTVLVENGQLKWIDLARECKKSTATLSLWKHGKYTGNVKALERSIERIVRRFEQVPTRLTSRDSNTLTKLLQLLDESDDRTSILATLVRF
jgi:hypothetical protein